MLAMNIRNVEEGAPDSEDEVDFEADQRRSSGRYAAPWCAC